MGWRCPWHCRIGLRDESSDAMNEAWEGQRYLSGQTDIFRERSENFFRVLRARLAMVKAGVM
jgi:hypothetical protein